MERIWIFFLRKSSFTILVLIALLVFGVSSILTIPRESSPEVVVPIAIVSTIYPGASSADIEKLITDKIEDTLSSGLEDVKKITSTSAESVSSVVVEFNASADIDKSIQSTKDEIDKIKSDLPEDALDPSVIQIDFANQPILMVSVSSDLPVTEFIELSNQLVKEIESIKGVSKVVKSGVRDREVQIIVRQETLKKFNLRLTDVLWAVQSANNALPIGSIQMNGTEYALRFNGDITDPTQIQDIAILNNVGEPIYLRDVAFVSNGVSKNNTFSRISESGSDPTQALSLSIFKKAGGDITRINDAVNTRLEELKSTILKGTTVLTSYDIGEFIKRDLKNLSLTALQTILLVMIILLLTLGWREAVLAGFSIPVSFLIAFIGLKLSGNTINFVSLFSLILAVGILVDAAIVVTEGTHERIKLYPARRQAAAATIREFHWPLTSGAMTTIAVFAPLFIVSGITGQFIASIPFTIIFVLLASLFVALGLLPLFASLILRKKDGNDKFSRKQEFYTRKLQSWYKSKLEAFIGNKRKEHLFYLSVTVLFIISMAMPFTGLVKTVFFPAENSEFLFLEIEKPAGTVLGETDLTTRQIEEILQADPRVDSFITTVGSNSPFTGGIVSSGSGNGKISNITIILKDDLSDTSQKISDDLRIALAQIKSAEIRISEMSSGPPTGNAITLRFLGEDLNALEKTAARAAIILKDIPGTINVKSSSADDNLEFVLTIDRAKASEVGMSATSIAGTLRTAIQGQTTTTIKTGTGDEIDVELKLDLNPRFITPHDTTRANIDQLQNLEILTPVGPVLLGSIVDFSIQRSPTAINHEDQKRIVSVTSSLTEGAISADILSAFDEKISQLDSPLLQDGVELKIGGEQEDINQSFKDMGIALIIGILLILSILVLQFNSYRQAFIIIAIVPITLIGIFFGLFITGKTVSFPSIMGFIALAGIVVNNSIILIDKMNTLRIERPNDSIKNIVLEGATSRLRPILLTSLTTVIGIIPLTYASALWSPLAFAIIFGLSFAVVITLWLVPTMYYRRYSKHRA
ncbi:MAG: hypothetical protein COU10_00595 [Candidatus Harrisonbacteria bacterium CG10_big_fil_rev_8_21_14_0_10_45_28]|uniref:AcrB/AcrD/AcrF family protein n=1 Tax=Candidatus Harrisonbacteria bacterium CG10_big_fil_rev_8_21_14_0_10_45_28 TaxID=1974586 RepID=A0A2H0UP38_9BACT|nr:MAG: hypothetical protein COU10_00595 [Candidatus Harrisonbacteria bacterium CG10_big_fil_rev_8_21_14_0_10_45_28]